MGLEKLPFRAGVRLVLGDKKKAVMPGTDEHPWELMLRVPSGNLGRISLKGEAGRTSLERRRRPVTACVKAERTRYAHGTVGSHRFDDGFDPVLTREQKYPV